MKLRKQHTKPAAILPKFGLWAATKFKTCAEILPVLKAGLAEVGENRAQEFRDKFDFFTAQAFGRFIGALQTNKAKYVVGKAELIQSVDRLALAEEINRLAAKSGACPARSYRD